MSKGSSLGMGLMLMLWGCQPQFDERASIVTGPRILAVRAEPPESAEGQSVTYEALIASPEGSLSDVALNWTFCTAPKALTENNAVSAACLDAGLPSLPDHGLTITAASPANGCQLFGPEPPPGDFRPRDADKTGGYYQPLRVTVWGQTVFAFERLTCDLANAPLDVAVDFVHRYTPNRNPQLLAIEAFVGDKIVNLDAVPVGSDVHFSVGWNVEDPETFVAFDPRTQSLVLQRESMRVSWYATAGEFDTDITGRDEADVAHSVDNTWRAPNKPQQVFVWVVLRDSRGGMDSAAFSLQLL